MLAGRVEPGRRNGGAQRTPKNGSILQVHHPEHGWLAFVFPVEHAALLGQALVKQSALCEYFAGTLPPSRTMVTCPEAVFTCAIFGPWARANGTEIEMIAMAPIHALAMDCI